MTLLIQNATVITGDDRNTIFHEAAIAIEGNRIAAIGPTDVLAARYPGAETVDATGRVIFPGFANIHTHLQRSLI